MDLPVKARTYLATVIATALVVSSWAGHNFDFASHWTALMALAGLNILVESAPIRYPQVAAINLGWIVGLASAILLGPAGAALVALSGLLGVNSTPLVKRLFNASQLVLSVTLAALTYLVLGGELGFSHAFGSREVLTAIIIPALAADVVHCLVNGSFVAGILSMTSGVPFRRVIEGSFLPQVLSYLGYGLFGLLLAVLWDGVGIGPFAAVLVLMPLFIARWAYAQYAEQQLAYDRTVRALVQAVETKDLYTRGHSERVAQASVMIARQIQMREDRVPVLRYAGILHDVGKLGVPTRVLQKSGRLSEEEFAAIRMHPVRGLETVQGIEFLEEAYAGILHHHERMDGRGYPMGLTGGQIPEFARVIAVADAFDSMTTTRSYRGARSVEEAMAELRTCAGSQFDPIMVDAMIAALGAEGWHPTASMPDFEAPAGQSVAAAFDHDDPMVDVTPLRRADVARTDRAVPGSDPAS